MSSKLSTLTIQPSPPNGDFNRYPKTTLGSRVGLVILRTSPPPGAQVSYTPPNHKALKTSRKAPKPKIIK
ncbi:hypothetical protein CLOP_g9936 [Closterium sp. NIES-67]|nr:hypothetical protein CLOP_g8972 [Closterium sp. NIES-67]GJP79740.1 hypothetical protein CLOP_g9936 [Closterium sp. NIES-67]